MIRALRTGNYSVVIGWLAEELTEDEHAVWRLQPKKGTRWFIMRPVRCNPLAARQHSGLKIHSNLYH
jgi:cell division inhibitor SulA